MPTMVQQQTYDVAQYITPLVTKAYWCSSEQNIFGVFLAKNKTNRTNHINDAQYCKINFLTAIGDSSGAWSCDNEGLFLDRQWDLNKTFSGGVKRTLDEGCDCWAANAVYFDRKLPENNSLRLEKRALGLQSEETHLMPSANPVQNTYTW
ncbi:hypothetical protein BDZ94DRAFT_1242222 [Collybia nuda]|uniref:Uncharacterized protein n=1 Tax=Collybia nuda TaxID=64659 RepID=A0A9P6CBX9_9AGAR|nr:hypothetical protein BDZ94DRAFT_1242222 [Collybia nuda]